jgi:hypothetical protein
MIAMVNMNMAILDSMVRWCQSCLINQFHFACLIKPPGQLYMLDRQNEESITFTMMDVRFS